MLMRLRERFHIVHNSRMAGPQVNIRCSESQHAAWKHAAQSDERDLVDWARRVLDLVADSGLNIVQLRDLLNPPEKPKKK